MDERGAITPRLNTRSGDELPAAASSVYGPVFSWRHGESVGIDLLLHESTCSFHCVYCQLGDIRRETLQRNVFVPTSRLLADLRGVDWSSADAMTFSGSGEPTLAANLGDAIEALRSETGKTIVVLTNGSLLTDDDVQHELARADHVSCKLDAATDSQMQKINRPMGDFHLEGLVASLERFRRLFDGCLSIQTMVLPNNENEAEKFAALLTRIRPDEVHLNVPSRPRPREWTLEARGAHRSFDQERAFRTVSRDDVQKFAGILHARMRVKVLTPPQVTPTELPRSGSTTTAEEHR